ncbi:MAG: aminotransferase class I/II-fold pyridoxal phosphate-dependent enzyme [Ornithinimicrobium sp.]
MSASLLHHPSDDELRGAGALKWSIDPPGVIPAWVAEMDLGLAEPIHRAVRDYADRGIFGYADPKGRALVGEALSGFALRRWGHHIDPDRVLLVGDVMDGLTLTLQHVAPAAPVIIPTPVYPPFFVVTQALGLEIRAVPLIRSCESRPDGGAARAPLVLDLEAIEEEARRGARTLLLCQPHNPVGRSYSRPELLALRDIVERWGVHVISDEIHAPLTLPGVEFVPYASVASADAAVTTLISATKAFSMPGLRCAQLISHRARDHDTLTGLHPVLNHSMTTIGQQATVAAYTAGEAWLDEVCRTVAEAHERFRDALDQRLPKIDVEVAEATYLAWLNVRGLRVEDPVAAALTHGVRVDSQGEGYGPGSRDHIRVNLATSSPRLDRLVDRLCTAWDAGSSTSS